MDSHDAPIAALPENAPAQDASPAQRASIAPWWHTVVLVAAFAWLSWHGAKSFDQRHGAGVNRFVTYAMTAGMELVMVGWVWLGLRLRKVSFGTIVGKLAHGAKGIAIDVGVAAVFWLCAMSVLSTLNLVWLLTESAVTHQPLIPNVQPAKPGAHKAAPAPAPSAEQEKLIKTLARTAPSNRYEIAAWALLCIVVGFAEEVVFRGYLQRQFAAWFARWPQWLHGYGPTAIGVALSAIVFGSAHGYEGARGMALIGVYGVLFGLLALFRRNLRAGMIAHGWHDLFVGLMLALMKNIGFISSAQM